MTRIVLSLVLVVFSTVGSGCSWHRHRVGLGPVQGKEIDSVRQYYLLFGLIRVNNVDTEQIASGFNSYEVTTEQSFMDVILSPFLLPFTVTTRTVTVTQ